MATRWMREVMMGTQNNIGPYGDYSRGVSKAFQFFLQYCCGFTNLTQYLPGGGSFDSYEATGTDGGFTGAAKAAGSITTIVSANHINGQQMTLDDGYNIPTTFTFSSAPAAITDIDITGVVSADVMRDRIIDAINTVRSVSGTLWLDATVGGAATVTVTNWRYATRGNVTSWTEDVVDAGFVLTQPTGGLDGWVMTEGTTTPFTIGTDEGKFVVVVDPTNDVNNGVYIIKQVLSTSEVLLDFKADIDNGEAFTAVAGGLTWYMFAPNYNIPNTDGSYFRLQSPHTTNWAIELAREDTFYNEKWKIRVCVDGNWGASIPKILQTVQMDQNMSPARTYNCCEVDTEGVYLNFWMTGISSATNNPSSDRSIIGFIIDNLTPIEPERSAIELVVLHGGDAPSASKQGINRYDASNEVGHGRMWSELTQSQYDCYMVDNSYDTASQGFQTGIPPNTTSEVNHRLALGNDKWTIGKNEVQRGSLVLKDPNYVAAAQNEFEHLGWMNGHLTGRNMGNHTFDGAISGATRPWRHNIQMNQGGDKNKMCNNSFIFSWPAGITKADI